MKYDDLNGLKLALRKKKKKKKTLCNFKNSGLGIVDGFQQEWTGHYTRYLQPNSHDVFVHIHNP